MITSEVTSKVEMIADLEVTNLFMTKDQSHPGRCLLALKFHKTEFFQLSLEEQQAYARDLSRATKAIYDAFTPDKLNYGVFGDNVPHFHIHLVPKYKGGKDWGKAFDNVVRAETASSFDVIETNIKLLKQKLSLLT
jgi:diadenosine tetraphosphate (Ap4A) HIT family hydrolase